VQELFNVISLCIAFVDFIVSVLIQIEKKLNGTSRTLLVKQLKNPQLGLAWLFRNKGEDVKFLLLHSDIILHYILCLLNIPISSYLRKVNFTFIPKVGEWMLDKDNAPPPPKDKNNGYGRGG
jgi:hypothetical protein